MLYVNGQPFVSILAGNVNGNSKNITSMGNITFVTGAALASGGTNGNTLLLKANDTTFITLTTGATDAMDLGAHTVSGNLTGTSASFQVNRDIHTNVLLLNGGTDDSLSAYWSLYGKNHSTEPGYAELRVPDAAKTARLLVMQVSGATDNPAITWLAAARHSSMNFASAAVLAGIGTGANGIKLKNLKNAAATALSGTQLDVEIDIGGTPYYFTVFPTKA